MKFPSFGDILKSEPGLSSGFDYLRLLLASSVFVWHAYVFTHSAQDINALLISPIGNLIYAILPAFFALSGFLIASSLVRCKNVGLFVWLRIVRIFPALAVVVMLTVLVMGPLVTSVGMREYFSHKDFFRYFLNAFGLLNLWLPGVFMENPAKGIVNASMWTIAWEFKSYLLLGALALTPLIRYPAYLWRGFCTAIILGLAYCIVWRTTENRLDHFTGPQLMIFFAAGAALFLYRDRIPYIGSLAVVCAVISIWLINHPTWFLASVIPLAYCIAWGGLQNPAKIWVIKKGDYSYSVYLYGGPIQQLVWQYSETGREFGWNLLISAIVTLPFAIFSWHVVEKPALRLKKAFSFTKISQTEITPAYPS